MADEICKEEWIQTYPSGRRVNPANISVDDIDIRDLAHHLSLINRFTGGTPEPYSVSQHSVLVSNLCPPEHALWGLLHDAPEAYMTDMSRPVKKLAPPEVLEYWKKTERAIMDAVCAKYGLKLPEPPEVKVADDNALANEAYAFFGHSENYKLWHHRFENGYKRLGYILSAQHWKFAESEFLRRFIELTGGVK